MRSLAGWLAEHHRHFCIRSTRPGGHVGYVGVTHGVTLPGEELFFSHVHLHGRPRSAASCPSSST